MGVKVQFGLTCTADRVATITTATEDIDGDKDFISSDAQDRPADWAQNVLSLSFFEDSGYTTAMTDNIVQFGETVYAQVDTNVASEDIHTRITDCWATKDAASTSTPKFDLISTSCIANDPTTSSALQWMNLDSTTNGASETSNFNFQAFRFPDASSFYLHCTGMFNKIV